MRAPKLLIRFDQALAYLSHEMPAPAARAALNAPGTVVQFYGKPYVNLLAVPELDTACGAANGTERRKTSRRRNLETWKQRIAAVVAHAAGKSGQPLEVVRFIE